MEYKIRNDNTGMVVTVRGEQPPPVDALPQIFADAQKRAVDLLASGEYAYDENLVKLGKKERRERLSRLSAQAIGAAPEDVDIYSGMGTLGRIKLSFQPTEQDKIKHLEDTYGRENVRGVQIGNRVDLFYKDDKETQGKWRMVDEEGKSWADVFADPAGEVIPTAGAVAGAAVGSLASPVVGTAAGAAIGYGIASSAQDVAARAIGGEQIKPGEIAGRRSFEAAIGLPIDLATAGTGKFFSRRIGRNLANDFAKSMDEGFLALRESDALRGMTLKKGIPPALKSTEGRSVKASELAEIYPNSKIAKQFDDLRGTIYTWKQLMTGGAGSVEAIDNFGKVASGIADNYRTLLDDIAAIDKRAADTIEKSMSTRLQGLVRRKTSVDSLGKQLQELWGEGSTVASKTNDANWMDLDAAAKQYGVSVSPQLVAKTIRRSASEMEPLVNKPLMELADEIESLTDPLSFTQLRRYLNRIEDAVPGSTEANFKTAQQVAIAAGKSVRELRSELVDQAKAPFKKQYEKTMGFYLNDYLNFKRGAVGRGLREEFGDIAKTPRAVANEVLSDPSYVKQALRAARLAGPDAETTVKESMKDAYMTKIGLVDGVEAGNGISFDEEIVRELFGARHVKDLQNLNKRLQQASKNTPKLLDGKVTREDVYKLFSAFSGDDKGKVMSAIVERAKKQADATRLMRTELINKLLPKEVNGTMIEPKFTGSDLAHFASDFITADITTVKRAMKAIRDQGDEQGLKSFKEEFLAQLLARYASGAQTAGKGAVDLWNAIAFKKALKGRSGARIKANLVEVLEETDAKAILAINDLLEGASSFGAKLTGSMVQPRFAASERGIQLYFVGNLVRGLRNRFMVWAYGSDQLLPLLNWLAKDVGTEKAEKNFQKIFLKMIGTERGLMALARQTQQDPSFAETANSMIEDIGAESRSEEE